MKKIFIFLACFMLAMPPLVVIPEEVVPDEEVPIDEVVPEKEADYSAITDEINNSNDNLTSQIDDLKLQMTELQNTLDGVYTGKSITLTDLKPNTRLHITVNGETSETGEGEKSPDNPYVLSGVENPTITVTDGGGNVYTYPIITDSPLYSLPNGICDYIEIDNVNKTAKLVRNVGCKVFDGTESIGLYSDNQPDYCTFVYYTSLGVLKVACTHFPYFDYDYATANAINSISVNSSKTGCYFKVLGIFTTNDFRTWLAEQYNAGRPVIVQYQLAEPVIEYIEPISISAYSPNTTISIDKGSLAVKVIPPTHITDDDTIFVLTFCLYAFALIMVTFVALRVIFGFCRTSLDVLSWLPFKNVKLFKFKERRRIFKDD